MYIAQKYITFNHRLKIKPAQNNLILQNVKILVSSNLKGEKFSNFNFEGLISANQDGSFDTHIGIVINDTKWQFYLIFLTYGILCMTHAK